MNWCHTSKFFGETEEKLWYTSACISDILIDARTEQLPNTDLECYRYDNPLASHEIFRFLSLLHASHKPHLRYLNFSDGGENEDRVRRTMSQRVTSPFPHHRGQCHICGVHSDLGVNCKLFHLYSILLHFTDPNKHIINTRRIYTIHENNRFPACSFPNI
jgi:hypothetical protein